MAEAFRILAEHFAEKDNINVTLSDKGEAYSVPSEKRIVLPDDVPDEMFGVTLATLLHESYHLKCSDPSCRASAHGQDGSPLDFIINVLEDIRIDAQILKKYPNAKNLYSDLLDYIMTKKGDQYNSCPKEIKILKEFIMRSYSDGTEFERFFSQDEEIKKFFEDNKSEIEVITRLAKNSLSTRALEPMAKNLMKLLFPTWKEDFLKKFNGSQLLKEATDRNNKSTQEYTEASKAFQPVYREENGLNNAKRKVVKDMKTNENIIESYENYIKANENNPEISSELMNQYKEEIERRKDVAKKLKDLQAELDKKWKEFMDKHSAKEIKELKEQLEKKAADMSQKNQELYCLREDVKNKEMLADKELSKILKQLDAFSASFTNIDKKDFIITERINQTMSERLMEFLKNKQERRIIADEGKIAPNKLPTFFDPNNLFEQKPEDLNKKTRVFFVIDRSSSMSEGLRNDNYNTTKHKAVTSALDMIFTVLDKAIKDEGIDIEYALYAFDTGAYMIKDFNEETTDKSKIYNGIYPNGGTEPSKVLEEIEKVFCDDVNTKEIVLFMTDGDFGSVGYERLESLLQGRKKWVFLGIDINMEYPESKKIFGRYNITQIKDIQKALTLAIEDAI